MQVIVAVPKFAALVGYQNAAEALMRPVCGVPLLTRTIATATRAGTDVLLVWPEGVPEELAYDCLESAPLRQKRNISIIRVRDFDPCAGSSWANIQDQLEGQFLWLPWNWVTNKQSLAHLPMASIHSVDWHKPAYLSTHEIAGDEISETLPNSSAEGVAVVSPKTVEAAERFLVAYSGKVLDGIHTSFNRRLCRPLVRLLTHTSITPNAVTFGGVFVSILSAIAFAHGTYWSYVTGAFVFFIAGLFDEMDGMLARIKFADSPFGTWREGFADGLSYLLLFGGTTIGLYRQYGRPALIVGAALLVGTLLALITISLQRKRATSPDRPNEHLGNFYRLLEKDSSNLVSKVVRQVHAFQKRGVLIHYVVLFTVVGGLPIVFFLATLGSHLTWILALYFNHGFFQQPAHMVSTASVKSISEAL